MEKGILRCILTSISITFFLFMIIGEMIYNIEPI